MKKMLIPLSTTVAGGLVNIWILLEIMYAVEIMDRVEKARYPYVMTYPWFIDSVNSNIATLSLPWIASLPY